MLDERMEEEYEEVRPHRNHHKSSIISKVKKIVVRFFKNATSRFWSFDKEENEYDYDDDMEFFEEEEMFDRREEMRERRHGGKRHHGRGRHLFEKKQIHGGPNSSINNKVHGRKLSLMHRYY